jgi:hypothetical protein
MTDAMQTDKILPYVKESQQMSPFYRAFPGVHELSETAVFDKMAAFRRY